MAPHPASRDLLLLDGWQHRREPSGHWQGWLAQAAVDTGWTVAYPTLPDPQHPSLQAWWQVVADWLGRHPGGVVVAHGLSALTWLRFAGRGTATTPRAGRVLLVAPPAADADETLPPPAALRALSDEPPLLVFSADDPWCVPDAGTRYAAPLGLDAVRVERGGHLNAASGFGPWPAALHWLTTGSWPDPGVGAVQALTDGHRPSGRRAGIVLAGPVPAALTAHAAHLITVTGHRPLRRLATLRPRYGEPAPRAEDVTAFVRRYGHEYTVVVVTEELDSSSLVDACRSEGCRLVTTAPAPEL